MRFKLAAVALVLFAAAIVGVSSAKATTSDSCVDFGPGYNNCFAQTSEDDVDFAVVNMGRYSFGTFTLVCTNHDGDRFVKQGRIGIDGRRFFTIEDLFGLRNPDCTLGAHANANNHRARVRVILVD